MKRRREKLTVVLAAVSTAVLLGFPFSLPSSAAAVSGTQEFTTSGSMTVTYEVAPSAETVTVPIAVPKKDDVPVGGSGGTDTEEPDGGNGAEEDGGGLPDGGSDLETGGSDTGTTGTEGDGTDGGSDESGHGYGNGGERRNKTGGRIGGVPATGDESRIVLHGVTALGAAAVLILWFAMRKKDEKD